jgi:hypothetical protein
MMKFRFKSSAICSMQGRKLMSKVASTCDESYQSRLVVLPTEQGFRGFDAISTEKTVPP